MKIIQRTFIKIKKKIKENTYNSFLHINPWNRRKNKIIFDVQNKSISLLNKLSRTIWNLNDDIGYRNILIDGMWDNPNYWIRFNLIRAAMGYKNVNEIGILGKYNRKNVKNIFSKLGINNLIDYELNSTISKKNTKKANFLIKNTKTSSDILKWDLPHQFPSDIFYDAILKRQRKMHVDIYDPSPHEEWKNISLKADNPKLIAEAIMQLKALNPDERLKMGKTGYEYVVKNLNYISLTKKLAKLL